MLFGEGCGYFFEKGRTKRTDAREIRITTSYSPPTDRESSATAFLSAFKVTCKSIRKVGVGNFYHPIPSVASPRRKSPPIFFKVQSHSLNPRMTGRTDRWPSLARPKLLTTYMHTRSSGTIHQFVLFISFSLIEFLLLYH